MIGQKPTGFLACDARVHSELDKALAEFLPPILHFESSSLSEYSYPVSVGLCYEGQSHYWAIQPRAHWLDWDTETQNLHGFTRRALMEKGLPVCVVCEEMRAVLGAHEIAIYSDTPKWDNIWLSKLGLNNPIEHINLLVPRKLRRTFYRNFLDIHERFGLTHYHAQHDALALAMTLTLLLDRVRIETQGSDSPVNEQKRVCK